MKWFVVFGLLLGIATMPVEMSLSFKRSVVNGTVRIHSFVNYTMSNMASGNCVQQVP